MSLQPITSSISLQTEKWTGEQGQAWTNYVVLHDAVSVSWIQSKDLLQLENVVCLKYLGNENDNLTEQKPVLEIIS